MTASFVHNFFVVKSLMDLAEVKLSVLVSYEDKSVVILSEFYVSIKVNTLVNSLTLLE